MYGIAIKGSDGTVFYVERFLKRRAYTTSCKHDALTFFSLEELKHKYKEVMGEDSFIDKTESNSAPFIVML